MVASLSTTHNVHGPLDGDRPPAPKSAVRESLPTLEIGSVPIDFPVVQAALSGYSDGAMRLLARRLGAGYTLCEVVLDKFILQRGRKGRGFLRVAEEEHPVGCQLMGANPDEFAEAAAVVSQMGYDVVDINFGCPVRKVLGRCRGGFLLGQPDTATEIIARVRDAVPADIPVTVKMRRGVDDSDASRESFFQILDGAYSRGVAAVTVHGRTVEQRYDGPSRWAFLRDVKQHAGSRTVLGSGDLFTAHDCLRMMQETGVDGVTVARGAIGNPWIFRDARALAEGKSLPAPPTLFEQRDVIREHYRLAEEIYGAEACCRQMRKFGIRYAQLHPEPLPVRDAFVRVKRPEDWQRVLTTWYSEDLPGRHPDLAEERAANAR